VSNERRPGLTYNTSNDGNVMGLSVHEGSELDAFLAEHELGVPFVDYLVDHYRGKELARISKKALNDLYKKWPKHAKAYQQVVTDEVAQKLAALAQEAEQEPAATLAEPETEFVLKDNQKLAKRGGQEVIIETPRRSKRVRVEVPDDKRYAMFDSLHSEDFKAVELDNPKEKDVEPTEPEST
jgi:arsenate reductase-like glutaredoxin family protein